MIEILNSKQIPLSKLTANNGQIEGIPKNPRFIKNERYQKLVKSIQDNPEFLGARELIVYEHNGKYVVLCGNMRYRAAKELGFDSIPCKVIPEYFSIEQIKAIIIKDNISFGDDDFDALANEWDATELEEWGFEFPDLGEDFEPEILEAEEDDFLVPEGGTKTDIVLGDLFEIGEHRLLCGDSTQTDSFEKLMQGEFADMVVTDPPYNVAYEGGTKEKLTIENDSMSNDDFYQFLYDFYSALTTAVKKGGAIYVWHASSEVINFGKAMVDAGWLLKQQLIWVKNTMVMGRQDYQWKHEPCLYGWLAGGSHNWYSDRKQTTVINFDKPQRNGEHPTMKPIGLFAYQIENSSKIGDIVIDAFGGSGTTMVACEQLKRKARLIEYDPKYCQVIIDRMLKLNPNLIIKRNGILYNK